MADPVASVEKIVKIGLKIKEAVDTVRRNKEVCLEIRKCVLRYSAMLSQLHQRGVMDNNQEMSSALEDLAETLERALELVTACQERSAISRFVSAGDLAKQLRRMKETISEQVMLSLWALNVHNTMVLLTMQDVIPLSRQPEDTTAMETSCNNNSTDDARVELYGDGNNVLSGSKPLPSVDFKRFSLSEVKAAIDDKNIIGEGAYCTTFKAVLNEGNVVAVKIYRKVKRPFPLPIYDHVSKLQHKNIVKVLGYCYEYKWHVQLLKHRNNDQVIEKGYLIEELMPNGSLINMIKHGLQLEWPSVFRIIEGVAQAVHFLHEQHIVHMDVKPGNILLDSDMNPKITDFDISTVLHADADEFTTDVEGTIGFLAPELLYKRIVSTKNDVYAFGVTLFETVSCMCRSKSPRVEDIDFKSFFYEWVWEAWQAGRVEELFEPSLFDCSQLLEIKRCIHVGFLCIEYHRTDRPTMAEVLEMINGKEELPTPKRINIIASRKRRIIEARSQMDRAAPDDTAL